MDCTLSRPRRLAGKLVRELGRRGDRSATDPRTALIRRELETGSFAALNPETGEFEAIDPDTGEFEAIEQR